MSKKPTIGSFYDEEEQALIEDMEATINADDFAPQSILTADRLEMHREAARNALNEKTTQVTIRLPRTDLVRLKAQAAREGLPYQTLIKSILHKSIS
jgi:predicted DNA binding CopG/RHH family protein